MMPDAHDALSATGCASAARCAAGQASAAQRRPVRCSPERPQIRHQLKGWSTCLRSIWWLPPFRQDVRIHTVLDLRDAPGGRVIAFQWDYVLLSETLLYHAAPAWLGALVRSYILPLNGLAVSALGLACYAVYDRVGGGAPLPC